MLRRGPEPGSFFADQVDDQTGMASFRDRSLVRQKHEVMGIARRKQAQDILDAFTFVAGIADKFDVPRAPAS